MNTRFLKISKTILKTSHFIDFARDNLCYKIHRVNRSRLTLYLDRRIKFTKKEKYIYIYITQKLSDTIKHKQTYNF